MKVILETPTTNSKKELQRLMGRLAALGRFIANFTDKLRHFFLILKGASMLGWTDKCEQSFGAIKRYLTEPPILSNPKSSEELYVYLVISYYAISVVLFRQIRDKKQRPVYYVSKVMVGIETRYSQLE